MRNIPVIVIMFVCLIGCGMYKVYYDYDIGAKNTGEAMLRDVIITSDRGFWHETGYLNIGATKTLGGLKPVPPNSIYTIVVERMDNKKTKSVVDLHDKIEKGFRGEIVFLVGDNNHISYRLE